MNGRCPFVSRPEFVRNPCLEPPYLKCPWAFASLCLCCSSRLQGLARGWRKEEDNNKGTKSRRGR